MTLHLNRKLLVSVFDAQEAREAAIGGGRIIDCEDPRSALGNIKPLQIMAIAQAVLDFKRSGDLQVSTNIGEDQLLFRRSETGEAIQKGRYEIAGKAAQAAIGVAASMGTDIHPTAIVKVGLDGMSASLLQETLTEVVNTLQRTRHYCQTHVMSVLFAQHLDAWHTRKHHYRKELLKLGEFVPVPGPDAPNSFDLLDGDVAVGSILNPANKQPLFNRAQDVSLQALIGAGVLPPHAQSAWVRLNEPYPHAIPFPDIADGHRTNRAIIKKMVEITAASGAHGIMLDTSVLSKTVDICLVDTAGSDMVDLNAQFVRHGHSRQGILKLDDLRYFVDCCHQSGLVANLAGSINSYQAQMLWAILPDLDQLSTRGAASGTRPPLDTTSGTGASVETRADKVIARTLVRGLAPPEYGGVLNLPATLRHNTQAAGAVEQLVALISQKRALHHLPALQAYWVDDMGKATPYS
jgi:uncharacterized protein (UPF0264 family)